MKYKIVIHTETNEPIDKTTQEQLKEHLTYAVDNALENTNVALVSSIDIMVDIIKDS